MWWSSMCCKSGAKTRKIMEGLLVQQENLTYHVKQPWKWKWLYMEGTTKTIFLTLSGSNISIVVTAMKKQKTKEIMMWMTKTYFSIFNRLNFYFQIIHSIIPVPYSCGFWCCTWAMLTIPGITKIKYPLNK